MSQSAHPDSSASELQIDRRNFLKTVAAAAATWSVDGLGESAAASEISLSPGLKIEGLTMATEFENQQMIWMAWPTYECDKSHLMTDLYCELIEELKPYVPVSLLVNEGVQAVARETLELNKVPLDHVKIITVPYSEYWLRDMGPVFAHSDEHIKMLDFKFNNWGEADVHGEAVVDNALDQHLARLLNLEVVPTGLVGEGGNHEFNGRGTLMMVQETTLGRNPNLSKAFIEAEYRRICGVENFIWLRNRYNDLETVAAPKPGPNGEPAYAFGFGANHAGGMARFVSAETIVLAEVKRSELGTNDLLAEAFCKVFEENLSIINEARNQNDKPFKVVRIPAPMTEYIRLQLGDPMYEVATPFLQAAGLDTLGKPIWWLLAKSYAAFFMANGAVFVPQYWEPGRPALEQEKDAQAVEVLKQVFPDRRVVPIESKYSRAPAAGGGALQCLTAFQPKSLFEKSC